MSLLETPVLEAAWAALDFESTGAAPGVNDEPVQTGMAVWHPHHSDDITDMFRSYIHSPVRVTRAARDVHGIGNEQTAGAPSMVALWPEFKSRLSGAVVVAHGAGTERRFLRAFPMHGFGPWLDTLALSRAIWPELQDYSLGAVIGVLGLDARVRALCTDADWHDALFDAVACIVLLRHCVRELDLGAQVVGQLISMDAGAYHRRRSLLRTARSAGWA